MRRSLALASAVAVFAIGACRAFVDLDGLGGGDGALPRVDASKDPPDVEDIEPAETGGGDTGVDAPESDAGSDVDAGPPCPGTGGPTAVRIPTPDGGSFCIDSSEVTNAQYAAFLTAAVPTDNQGAFCTWNATYTPSQGWPFAMGDDLKPVVWVDWCDAQAFCKWAGKRLCRAIGGQPLTAATAGNVLASEQGFACSRGGERVYPYGSVYDATKCNGSEANIGGLESVKRPTCEGGFTGVFDLAGNAHEWMDSCVAGADPATDPCYAQKGSFTHGMGDMACSVMETWPRGEPLYEYAFRCCSD